jgi:hypothetical protein
MNGVVITVYAMAPAYLDHYRIEVRKYEQGKACGAELVETIGSVPGREIIKRRNTLAERYSERPDIMLVIATPIPLKGR